MSSFSRKPDNRRSVFLNLAGQIEGQLREAYAKRHDQGRETQVTIAKKLGIDRSAVNRRLLGRSNMTMETIADMVWALGHCIRVDIYDPDEAPTNGHQIVPVHDDTAATASSTSTSTLVLAHVG